MTERFTIHLDDLLERENPSSSRLISKLDEMSEREMRALEVLRFRGRCVVANGCFDILHPGHLSLLATLDTVAHAHGYRPIVALNSDESTRKLKGNGRPVVDQMTRATLINHLKWPLTVVIFDEVTPQRLMDILQPPIVVKGREYHDKEVVRWKDSRVIYVQMVDGYSTSRILGDTR